MLPYERPKDISLAAGSYTVVYACFFLNPWCFSCVRGSKSRTGRAGDVSVRALCEYVNLVEHEQGDSLRAAWASRGAQCSRAQRQGRHMHHDDFQPLGPRQIRQQSHGAEQRETASWERESARAGRVRAFLCCLRAQSPPAAIVVGEFFEHLPRLRRQLSVVLFADAEIRQTSSEQAENGVAG